MNFKKVVPNEHLRRARLLKGWSQAELAEQVGTSFEMVSRWERGVTFPSPHYRKHLCAVLGKTTEELGLMPDLKEPLTPLPSPLDAIPTENQSTERDGAAPPTEQAAELAPIQSQVAELPPPSHHSLEPTNEAKTLPPPLLPSIPGKRPGISRMRAGLLIGLAILVIAGGLLGSLRLLMHFGVFNAHNRPAAIQVVRGGTWTDDLFFDPDSFIPNAWQDQFSTQVDQALYLPLFYGDAQGLVHPGAASEVPTLQNGGISADAKTWTFHLRPGLVWSDGAPYDARDVDYTWRLWANPKFAAPSPQGVNQISSADVSADDLSITFHLKQAYAPFLSYWMDGGFAPLPAHHFSRMAPDQIQKSPDNLNPQVVSGPFIMAERVPGDHYTLVRNPRYYLAKEGLPYLDKVVFRVSTNPDATLNNLQAGSIDSAWFLDLEKWQTYQRLTNYTLTPTPTSDGFEAMYFNFHNTVLASHREVRQAMAMAMDQQALITQARHGFATTLCTDHGSAYHPGYDPNATIGCPVLDLALANQLLSEHGWVKGADGVRTKGEQRLEFEYSTTADNTWRSADEAILQRDFQAIGIKLDIHNYPADTFFGSFLPAGKASPPTGAVTGRFDIAEYEQSFGYDPDDSLSFACDQFPSAANNFTGLNLGFYCNPALDKLFAQELATPDPGVRQQLFEQIHQIYLTDFPFITLFSPIDLAMGRKGTHNYQPSPIAGETVNIWQWWCDNGKC